MAEIKVQRVGQLSNEGKSLSLRQHYATLCFYYPQYTLIEASELPARDLFLLIRTAQKLNAQKMADLTAIVAAPHGKSKDSVQKVMDHFKNLAKD